MSNAAEVLEVWESMFEVNEEYQRLICEECRVGVVLGFVGKHLKNKHGVKKVMAMKIEKYIRAQHQDWVDGWSFKPRGGLGPQKGLDVFDGIRCKFCRNFNSRLVAEVEEHWQLMGHGEMKGCLIEPVRMQSWGGRDGARPNFWVVEEREERKGCVEGCGGCGGCQEGHAEEFGDWQLEIIKDGLEGVGLGDEWVAA